MAYAGCRLAAAAFRSVGIEAHPAPDSDAETLELGGLHSSGEECLPHKVTLGDFLKVCRQPGFDPAKTAFIMFTAHGPCRFGQYAPYLRQQLRELGHGEVTVVSPTCRNGYAEIGEHALELVQTMWMGVVCGDLAQRFLLKTRPYETTPGDADAVFEESVAEFSRVMERPGPKPKERLGQLVRAVEGMRDRFRRVPARYTKDRPLIGLVGEIFCRLNTFSNDDIARKVEQIGGECWLSDIAEWVWYVNWNQEDDILHEQGRFNLDQLKFKIKTHFQHQHERALLGPVLEDIKGYEEPESIDEVLSESDRYLPRRGSLGEMVLCVGKAIYLHGKGVDGIIDISPFTCMNGIICEAIYPSVSREHDDIPIRICYFDGVNTNLERDLEIFLELTRGYQRRKKHARVYPDYFG